MPAPEGRTVRDQLEAWVAAQPEPKRTSALRLAGLSDLYSMIKTEGELTKKVRFSLQSPRIQKKLLAIGIDLDTTWVDMAKKAVDPTEDWFPDVTTRQHVADLIRPYVQRIGGTDQLSRLFFQRTDIDSFCGKDPKSHPGFENIVSVLKFCIEDSRSGGERSSWTTESLLFMEGQWNVFGRGNLPLPELVDKEAFTSWFASQVPHARVDHIAKRLNEALNDSIFSSNLLIDWRKGSLPSRSKFEALLRAIQIAFPEWLSAEFRTLKLAVPEPPTASLKTVASQEVQSPEQLPEKPKQQPSTVEEILARGLERIVQELRDAQTAREQPPAITRSSQPAADPGEVIQGMRFVLTAASFKRAPVFNLNEVEDTRALIGELARRLALMNSMSSDDKRAVLHRLRHSFDELYIQVRHMDAGKEDLPSMFLDMRMTATGLSGGDLDNIKS